MSQVLPTRARPGRASMRPVAAAAAALALAGCASFTPDGGFDRVAALTKERTGQAPVRPRTAAERDAARARVDALLREPLGADGAVELAFLHHPGLQARFGELALAEADRVRAGRLPNPRFGFGRLREAGGALEIERSVLFDVLGLLTLPAASRIEEERFDRTQLQLAHDAVALAAQVRKAYFAAVAAQELVGVHERVKEAADASSELARRMAEVGNFSALARLREQAFQADATAQLARARHQAVVARERLVRALGVSGAQLAFTLPPRLPDLPAQPLAPAEAEQAAMETRLDVRIARLDAERTARALGLTKVTRFINVLELGARNRSASGEPRADGIELELELPLFDFGATRAARAEATYMQAVHQAAQVAVEARSEVREAHSAYRTSYELARHHRDELVPLRKRISEETLLRYNGMLVGVFELLADAREQVLSVNAYVEALRDHWIAQTDLQTALTAGSPGGGVTLMPAAAATPADGAAH